MHVHSKIPSGGRQLNVGRFVVGAAVRQLADPNAVSRVTDVYGLCTKYYRLARPTFVVQ